MWLSKHNTCLLQTAGLAYLPGPQVVRIQSNNTANSWQQTDSWHLIPRSSNIWQLSFWRKNLIRIWDLSQVLFVIPTEALLYWERCDIQCHLHHNNTTTHPRLNTHKTTLQILSLRIQTKYTEDLWEFHFKSKRTNAIMFIIITGFVLRSQLCIDLDQCVEDIMDDMIT